MRLCFAYRYEDATIQAFGKSSPLRAGPPPSPRRLPIVTDHDHIDRQTPCIRRYLIDGVASCKVPLRLNSAGFQQCDGLIQGLSMFQLGVNKANLPNSTGSHDGIRHGARSDRQYEDFGFDENCQFGATLQGSPPG